MVKTKAKRLLSLLLALATVMSLTVTPVYAADDDDTSGETTASETGETSSEPEQVAEDTEADASEEDALEADASDPQENLNAGISLASTDEDGEEEETSSETVAETVTLPNAENGVITLTEDVALTEQYVLESGTVTIDLNGHSITHGTDNTYTYLIVVKSGATLTIKDSNAGNNIIEGGVYASGTLTIESGTIDPTGDYGVYVSGGSVTVSGGTISAYYGVTVASGSLEVKEGATITATNRAVEAGSSASVTISGGTLSGTYAVMNFGGTLNISGGNISSSSHSGVYHSSGTTSITGGTITGKYAVNGRGGTINITGGAVTGTYGVLAVSGCQITIGTKGASDGPTITGGTEAIEISTSSSATASSTVTIYSGTITGTSYGICVFGENSSYYSKLHIWGGTITAETYFAISGNGTTGRGYDEIYIYGGTVTSNNAQAIYHPQQYGKMNIYGGTITGITGIEVRSGTVLIDDDADDTAPLVITATGSPTESDENYGGSTTSGAAVAIVPYNLTNISVTINSGTLSGVSAVYEGNTNNYTLTTTVTITLAGGTYDGDVTVTDADEDRVTVTVTGGTYSTDVTSYVDEETYSVVSIGEDTYIIVSADTVAVVYEADGDYVGSYSTLKAAYAATSTGGTMILVKGVDGEQLGASSDKKVTLDLNGHTISRSTGSVIDCSKGTLTITDSSETDSAIGTGMVKNTGGTAIKLTGGAVILESGTLESTSSYAATLSSGTLQVDGGAVIAASSANCIFYYTDGTLTINDGLFTVVNRTSTVTESNVTSGAIVNAGSSAEKDEDNVQVSITGGVFQMYRPLLGTAINLEISGGYFLSKYSLSNYYPDSDTNAYGYTSHNSVTYLGVTYSDYYQVAHVNFTLEVSGLDESYYTTLAAAVNAAITAYSSNNEADITITMNNDYETGKVPVESAVVFTLDLNGHTLTSTDKGVLKINSENAVVTITDNSTVGTGTITTLDAGSESLTSSTTGLLQVINGTLNIEGGYYNQNAGSSVFVIGTNGSVSVSGGYFTSDPSDYTGTYEVATNDSADYPYYVADVIYGKDIIFEDGKIILNVYVMDVVKDSSTENITGSLTGDTDSTRTTVTSVSGNSNYAYKLSQCVDPRLMKHTLTVEVTMNDGYVVTYTTSVREYCVDVIASTSSDITEAQKTVAKAMLNYGAATQTYTSYEADDLANTGYAYTSDELSNASTMSSAGVTLTRTYSPDSSSYTGESLYSMSVYYDYDFTVRLTYSNNIESAVTKVTLNGKELTENTDYTVSGKVISISGLSAYQMNQTICVETTDSSSNTLTTSLPGLYYAYLLADSSKDATKFLARTLYTYCTAVNALYTTGS